MPLVERKRKPGPTVKMSVRVGGDVVLRAVDYMEASDGATPARYKPVLHEGEHLLEFVGDPVPTIIQTGPAFAASRVSKYGY